MRLPHARLPTTQLSHARLSTARAPRVRAIAALCSCLVAAPAWADETSPPPPPAELAPLPPAPTAEQPSLTPPIIATGVTAALLAASLGSMWKFRGALEDRNEVAFHIVDDEQRHKFRDAAQRVDMWKSRALLFGGATLASVVVTSLLWSRVDMAREQPHRPTRFSIAPTSSNDGAVVSLDGGF